MDENNNVLTGDIAALRQFRDIVDRNINSTNQVENLKNEEKRLDKEINSNKKTLKDPMPISELDQMFEGRGPIRDAFVNSMFDISKAIDTLSLRQKF